MPDPANEDPTTMATRTDALLAAMNLREKVAQITQVDLTAITPDEVEQLGIGSVLSGGGGNPVPNTPVTWRAMVDTYVQASRRSRLGIPLLYGTDAVHGHNNVVGATIFPHNIGLGAAADPDLTERIARATAVETAATGARWAFAPTVAVPQDLRWGRTYEGFGQDPALVSELGSAVVAGLQGPGPRIDVLACAKHFVADGATAWGSTGGRPGSSGGTRPTGSPGGTSTREMPASTNRRCGGSTCRRTAQPSPGGSAASWRPTRRSTARRSTRTDGC
jgi:hypothetical protein